MNLRIAFPDLSDKARDRIGRRSFQNTARNLLEVSRLASLDRASISSLVEYDTEQDIKNFEAASTRGKGILYLTGHFSSWEILPAAHALYGHPLSFVTRPLDNATLERYLLRIRQSKKNQVIGKKNSARRILEELNSGGSVGILMDQNTSPQEGIFVDFFGIPASTSTSLALFALRTDATVLPGYLTPLQKGRYKIKFLPPMNLVRSGDMNNDVKKNTQAFNEVLEGIIREQPASWLWGHRRWKNQPPDNPKDIYVLTRTELERFLNDQGRPRSASPVSSAAVDPRLYPFKK